MRRSQESTEALCAGFVKSCTLGSMRHSTLRNVALEQQHLEMLQIRCKVVCQASRSARDRRDESIGAKGSLTLAKSQCATVHSKTRVSGIFAGLNSNEYIMY